MTSVRQQQSANPGGGKDFRLLKSIVNFQEDLKQAVADNIEAGHDVQIDYTGFDEEISNRMSAMLVREKGIGAVEDQFEDEDDEAENQKFKKSAVRSIYKKNGGLYDIVANYTFNGSLNDFQTKKDSTTCVVKCSELNDDPHYQVIAKSIVIEEYNPFPVKVNVKFENMPSSVISIDSIDRPLEEVNHVIFPNVSAPAIVSKTIYNAFSDEVRANFDHIYYHGVTPEDIEGSVEFIFDELDHVAQGTSKEELDALKDSLRTTHSFVKKESPLYAFMSQKYKIEKSAVHSDQFPEHIMMSIDHIAEAKNDFYNTMKKSPFGNIHNSKCVISRGDGRDWNSPEGMSRSEYEVYSKTPNQICLKVCYTIKAYEVPTDPTGQ
jgi:hypothetical protein